MSGHSKWIDEFDIDGLRLDVAYCLDKDFLKRLRSYTDSLKNDFLLLGELLHGDYNQFVNDDMHPIRCRSIRKEYPAYRKSYRK